MSKNKSKHSGNSQNPELFKGTSYSESEILQQPFPSAMSNQPDYFQSYIKYFIIYYNIKHLSDRETAGITQRQAIISTPEAFP